MPTNGNPFQIVNPGSGRLPAGTVAASAFVFQGGAGGNVALAAHIHNPRDAHMAGAIGIPPIDPVTGLPLLDPGPVDGESVLDFIREVKDLFPIRPNRLGFLGTGVNSGVPNWGGLDVSVAKTGGYSVGTNAVYSHFIVKDPATFQVSGVLYPADRGVLALYRTANGDFTNPFQAATLVGALYLGTTVPAPLLGFPANIPRAGFVEATRPTGQADYTSAGGGGVDQINLTWRLPYLKAYGAAPYAPYSTDFYTYQLATFTVRPQAVAGGGSQNWFLVHWHTDFASSLKAIDPAQTALTLADLTATNCFSAVPSSVADFDDGGTAVFTLARHNVYKDTAAIVVPALTSGSSSIVANTHKLSGVSFYDKTAAATLTYQMTASGLWQNSYRTSTTAPVPPSFYSDTDPLTVALDDFGLSPVGYGYDKLDNGVGGIPFSAINAPQPADLGHLPSTIIDLTVGSPYTVNSTDPFSRVTSLLQNLFGSNPTTDGNHYLWNSWDATGNAGVQGGYDMGTVEKFVDESYRYSATAVPVQTSRIKPTGGDVFDSTSSLTATPTDLQVVGSRLVYPHTDFSTASPVGPNYSVIPAVDGLNHLRRYTRAFNTGVARNTGKLRIRGLAQAAFTVDAPFDGAETTGHLTGGAIIQVKVPNQTGWLDIGRPSGDPALATTDFYGCAATFTTSGSDVFVTFQTGFVFTADNGQGEFPLFVRVSFLNNPAGLALSLDELEWQQA